MKLLLDTHALLWWWTDDRRLSATARKLVADEHNEVFVSAACAWEIATKRRLGKLGLPQLTPPRYRALLLEDGFTSLPVTTDHALLAGDYPHAHRDPFDRMLAAQSEIEGIPLASRDPALKPFAIDLIW